MASTTTDTGTGTEAEVARGFGLRYVHDGGPGISRRRSGRGFRYLDAAGQPVRDARRLNRIRALAIPPAWREVWIAPDPRAHIQATGRDARDRKQYRYHPRWQSGRGDAKFGRMARFGRALPAIRERVEQDLSRQGLPREKAIATAVHLLETTLIRVGNPEYARTNGSYGLTTLTGEHLQLGSTSFTLRFRGKSGVRHEVRLRDRRLATILRHCRDLPGDALLQYADDDGACHCVTAADVNAYLRDCACLGCTAKDFRTWAASVRALELLSTEPAPATRTAATRVQTAVIREVAALLGNTPAVCRSSYIHPAVLDAYRDGTLARFAARRYRPIKGLKPAEAALVRFLEATEQAPDV